MNTATSGVPPMKELEAKIIGSALLAEQDERDLIFREVRPSYFESEPLALVFKKLGNAYLKYPEADSTALFSELTVDERRDVLLMMDSMVSPAVVSEQLPDTLRAFREDWQQRKLKSDVTALAMNEPTPADIRALAEEVERFGIEKRDAAAQYLAEYRKPVEAIGTGFIELDRLLNGGFLRGTLTTIGARPSTGKTTFAINIATFDPNVKVLFISIEMTARMIYDRIVSDKADLNYNRCGLHLIDFETAKAVVERYPNLAIADDVADIEHIEQMVYRERPDMVVVDYIQIVTSQRRFTDNRQRIDYISQRLKAAAKKTGCCVISLSQITRGGKDRPTMSDLKESGGLEQDSDYIILLYREFVNSKEAQISPKDTTVTLDKNKFGNSGELRMDFIGSRQRFVEADDVITRPAPQESGAEEGDLPF